MAVWLSHKVLVLFVDIYWSVKLLRPGGYAAKEVWVRDGDGTYATAGMNLPCNLGLQHVDAVPQYVALFCRVSTCPCEGMPSSIR